MMTFVVTRVGTIEVPDMIIENDDPTSIEEYITEHLDEVELSDDDFEWGEPSDFGNRYNY